MTPSVSFITTVRVGDDARRRNLAYVLDWYRRMPDWEWIVVEQDAEPELDSADWPYELKRLFVFNPGPFNKGWGYNVGVGAARAEVLFFCDADLLIPHAALSTAAGLCGRRVLAVNPYDRLADLSAARSESLLSGAAEPDFSDAAASDIRHGTEKLCFCGGGFFMRRALHRLMGGFDERFLGWGGEDDAMTLRMRRVTGDIAEVEGRAALHLWHERGAIGTFGNPHYPNNLRLLDALRAAPDNALRCLCDTQRQIMGNPGKYERALD